MPQALSQQGLHLESICRCEMRHSRPAQLLRKESPPTLHRLNRWSLLPPSQIGQMVIDATGTPKRRQMDATKLA